MLSVPGPAGLAHSWTRTPGCYLTAHWSVVLWTKWQSLLRHVPTAAVCTSSRRSTSRERTGVFRRASTDRKTRRRQDRSSPLWPNLRVHESGRHHENPEAKEHQPLSDPTAGTALQRFTPTREPSPELTPHRLVTFHTPNPDDFRTFAKIIAVITCRLRGRQGGRSRLRGSITRQVALEVTRWQ